jgi:hypothetical protein
MNENNVHSEANFNPAEYEVEAYLDNRPPVFMPSPFGGPGSIDAGLRDYENERKAWEQELKFYFPGWMNGDPDHNIHKCRHCGNTNVRYIVACKHLPTGKNVVFGDICVDRLSFANRSEFKAAQVRARAAQANARWRVYAAREKFLAENPDFRAVLASFDPEAPVHAKNNFARDIVAKLNQYGSLSSAQINAFINSLERDRTYAAGKAQEALEVKGPVPTGRVEFVGEVVSKQLRDSMYGETWKLLVKLENNSKVWMTCPSSAVSSLERGMKAVFKATVEASKDDPSFGFGKRPTIKELPEAPVNA